MSSIKTIITSAACLAASALAAPAAQHPSSGMLQARWEECRPGTWWYTCGAIQGCYNYDPCIGGGVQAGETAATVAAVAPAIEERWEECQPGTWYSACGDIKGCFNYDPCTGPAVKPRYEECSAGTWWYTCGEIQGCYDYDPCTGPVSPPKEETPAPPSACPTDPQQPGARILPSHYWAVNPQEPDRVYAEEQVFHIYNDSSSRAGGSTTTQEQVLVFEAGAAVAAQAKTCKLNWYMDLQEETGFRVEGDGYVRFSQLPGFSSSEEAPSWNTAQQFASPDAPTYGPAMGGWDDKSQYLGHKMNSDLEVPCADLLAFHAKMDVINQQGLNEVLIEPGHTIGISIDYWC